jgi:hypothetical protein
MAGQLRLYSSSPNKNHCCSSESTQSTVRISQIEAAANNVKIIKYQKENIDDIAAPLGNFKRASDPTSNRPRYPYRRIGKLRLESLFNAANAVGWIK